MQFAEKDFEGRWENSIMKSSLLRIKKEYINKMKNQSDNRSLCINRSHIL